jgi:tetratricopeptide (TPR) repeat protein
MATPGPLPSAVDGRFAPEAECKRGGMGTVWKARDLRTGQAVALKLLHDASQADRFAREGALLSGVQHPGIVGYVAHGTTAAGVPYLAMEWLEGETAADRLARQTLTLEESLTLVGAAARATAAAHERGLVHRDLKPSNLFLRDRRLDDVVLLDLGLARETAGSSELTRSGSVLGTPSYMAPEQAQSAASGPAADVYSLGCVLFECLTGGPPFPGAHVFSVLAKVLFQEAPRLRDVRPELPATLDALVARTLLKDPAQRWPDGAAWLRALESLEQGPATVPEARPSMVDEQQLVSVILAPASSAESGALAETVAVHGGEVKSLADGARVFVLGQRGGSATDLAVRAARCALRLRGTLVVATGRGLSSQRAYIGEVIDRAGLLLRAAEQHPVSEIWLDETTAGLLDARFATRRVNDLVVLESEDPSLDPGRRLLGRPTTCVGREHELGMLELALRACVQEQSPRAVLVVGPPGIGKTRLRHELERQEGPVLRLLGLGDPIRTTGARGLLGGALGRLGGVRAEASDDENRAALAERLGRHLGPAARERVVAFLTELVGVPAPETPELRAAHQNPVIMADQVREAWLCFLRAEAAVQPVVLVLDDLQWSDAQTIALVGAALRDLTRSALLVLALARPEVLELFPDLWAPRLAVLPLHPLGAGAMTRLARQVLENAVSEDSVARMVERAGGNALYMEELIRAAESRREAVPETVLAMLQARIGLLPPGPRRLLRAASVFGETFPVAGVEALLPAEALELGTLARNEILEQPADERASGRWRFRHALMRDAAYGLLTPDDRRASHALAARYLAAAGEDPAVIGAHHQSAGESAEAIRHFVVAAEQAYRRNDLTTVMALVDRARGCGAEGEMLGGLSSIAAPALFYLNDFAGSAVAAAEALRLLPARHPRRVQSLASATFAALQLGRPAEVEARVSELLSAEPGDGDRAAYVRALGEGTISHLVLGKRANARLLLDRMRAVDALDGQADPLVHGHTVYWVVRAEVLLGDDLGLACRLARDSVACHARSGDRRMMANAQIELGECLRHVHSVEEGLAEMRRAVRLVQDIPEPVTVAWVRQYLAHLLAELGGPEDLAEARALSLSVIEHGGPSVYRSFGEASLARVHLREGDLETALDLGRRSQAMFRDTGLATYLPLVDRLVMEILRARGDGAGAAALADQALALLAEVGPLGLLEPALRLEAARAYRAAGREDDARAALRAARARFDVRAALLPEPWRAPFAAIPENAALLSEIG